MSRDPAAVDGEMPGAAAVVSRSEVLATLSEATRDRLLRLMAATAVPTGHTLLRQD